MPLHIKHEHSLLGHLASPLPPLPAFHTGMALPNINSSLLLQHSVHPSIMSRPSGSVPPSIGQHTVPRPTPLNQPSHIPHHLGHLPNPPPIHQNASQTRKSPESNKTSNPEKSETIDSASARGVFGWTTIDGVNIPYLMRDDTMFVAVRMVEMKLLSKYPSTYPEELQNKPPLMSHYVTNKEAKLLNEINTEHCANEYGKQPFNVRDLIVKLEDFIEFYSIVRKHFPESAPKKVSTPKPRPPTPVEGGWVQVNNTVVPFVTRTNVRFVPLSVIRYAAGLLSEVPVEGQVPTPEECKHLNEACQKAGLTFNFAKSTKLIPLEVVTLKSDVPVHIQDLPKDDPFSHAELKMMYEEEIQAQNPFGSLAGSGAPPAYPGMNQSPQTSHVAGSIPTSLPRQPIPTTTSASGPQFWMNPHLGVYPNQALGPTHPHNYMRPMQPYLTPAIQLLNNGQSQHLRNISNQAGRNTSPASRLEVNNNTNHSMKNSQALPSPTEGRPLSAGSGRSATPGENVGGIPLQRRLSGSSASSNRGSTSPHIAGRLPPVGPPGWHPTMGNPEEYQKMLQMLARQNSSPHAQVSSLHPSRQPLNQLARMGSSVSQNNLVSSANNTQSVIRATTNAKKPSPNNSATPPISRSSSVDSLSSLSKTTSNTQLNAKPTPQKESRIKPVEFFGKTLSCIIMGPTKDYYALVEAVARVYFPYCTLDEFQFALESILKLPATTLSPEDEKAFIAFYGLPTKTLMCNKVVKLKEFEQHMPKLNELFKDKADAYARKMAKKKEREQQKATEKCKDAAKPAISDQSQSAEPEKPQESSLKVSQNSLNKGLNMFKERAKTILKIIGEKRQASGEDSSQPPAKSRKRLEAAVLKLKQQQGSGEESPNALTPTEALETMVLQESSDPKPPTQSSEIQNEQSSENAAHESIISDVSSLLEKGNAADSHIDNQTGNVEHGESSATETTATIEAMVTQDINREPSTQLAEQHDQQLVSFPEETFTDTLPSVCPMEVQEAGVDAQVPNTDTVAHTSNTDIVAEVRNPGTVAEVPNAEIIDNGSEPEHSVMEIQEVSTYVQPSMTLRTEVTAESMMHIAAQSLVASPKQASGLTSDVASEELASGLTSDVASEEQASGLTSDMAFEEQATGLTNNIAFEEQASGRTSDVVSETEVISENKLQEQASGLFSDIASEEQASGLTSIVTSEKEASEQGSDSPASKIEQAGDSYTAPHSDPIQLESTVPESEQSFYVQEDRVGSKNLTEPQTISDEPAVTTEDVVMQIDSEEKTSVPTEGQAQSQTFDNQESILPLKEDTAPMMQTSAEVISAEQTCAIDPLPEQANIEDVTSEPACDSLLNDISDSALQDLQVNPESLQGQNMEQSADASENENGNVCDDASTKEVHESDNDLLSDLQIDNFDTEDNLSYKQMDNLPVSDSLPDFDVNPTKMHTDIIESESYGSSDATATPDVMMESSNIVDGRTAEVPLSNENTQSNVVMPGSAEISITAEIVENTGSENVQDSSNTADIVNKESEAEESSLQLHISNSDNAVSMTASNNEENAKSNEANCGDANEQPSSNGQDTSVEAAPCNQSSILDTQSAL